MSFKRDPSTPDPQKIADKNPAPGALKISGKREK